MIQPPTDKPENVYIEMVSHLRRATVRGIASALVLRSLGLVGEGLGAWNMRGEKLEIEWVRVERGLEPYRAAATIGPLTNLAIVEWMTAAAVVVIALTLGMFKDWAFPTTSVLLLAAASAAVLAWHHTTLHPAGYPQQLDFAKMIRTDDYWFAMGLGLVAFCGLAPLAVFLIAPGTRRLAAPRGPSWWLVHVAVGLIAFIATSVPLTIS